MKYILGMTWREGRIRLRNPVLPLWDILSPLIYLVVFGASFEQWFQAPPGVPRYSAFFLAGVLAMVTFVIAWNSSYAFFEDMQSGIFHELLTYPFPRRDLLLGKLIFNLFFALLASALCAGAAGLLLDLHFSPAVWAEVFLMLIPGMAGWYFFYTVLALKLRGFNAYHTTTSAIFLALNFVSNVFYPVSALPRWLRAAAWLNPVTWQDDLMRWPILGGPFTRTLQVEAAAFLGFTGIAYFIANRALNAPIE